MADESIRLTREELYERVWSTTAAKLAKEFGISDVALGKVCKKLGVPKPYPGYWQQLEAERKVHKPPLPPPKKGTPQMAVIHPNAYKARLEPQDPQVIALMDAESRPENAIRVADQLRHPHPLVSRAKVILQALQSNDYEKYGPVLKEPRLDIRASRQMLPRALRIMDALVKALEARGFSVELRKEGGRGARAVIGEEKVSFYLWEKDNRSEHVYTKEELSKPSYRRPDRWVFTPSGKLTFTIDEYTDGIRKKNWRDKEGKPLEEQLNEVMVGILTAAEALRLNEVKRREEERRRTEEFLRRQGEERRRQEEEERRLALEEQSGLWIKCQNIRAFVNECEKLLVEHQGHLNPEGVEAAWLRWAREHADRLDPLKGGFLHEVLSGRAG